MANEEISAKVKGIIASELTAQIDEVTDSATLVEDLGADSLDMVEIVMKLEEQFKVVIPDEDAEKIRTVGEAVKYIEERLA